MPAQNLAWTRSTNTNEPGVGVSNPKLVRAFMQSKSQTIGETKRKTSHKLSSSFPTMPFKRGKRPDLLLSAFKKIFFLERGGENGNGPTRQNHSVRFMATAAHSGLTQIFFFPSAGKKKTVYSFFPRLFFIYFFNLHQGVFITLCF